MKLTKAQREFLERAAQLARHDMGIIPKGALQRKMVDMLEQALLLEFANWGVHEETGVEAPMWKITAAGLGELARIELAAREGWSVLRHSGRDGAVWWVVVGPLPEERARRRFDELAKKIRQGGVRLVQGGEVRKQVDAPRLRTRW